MPSGTKLLPYLPEPSPIGRPLKWEMRSIINAIFYIVKSGCQWRMLPHQMPPWQTVYSHFRKWKTLGTWVMIHQALHEQIRCDIGKAPSPTVAIIDSQSVKTTELANSRGFDAHKKVKGRKTPYSHRYKLAFHWESRSLMPMSVIIELQ